MQNTKIGCLSDGQKSRIIFGMINMRNPNLLLLAGGVLRRSTRPTLNALILLVLFHAFV
jgi:ABC-type uncharacterized transport system ATPase subunit